MKDPLGRSKQIGTLRKRMTEELDIYGVYTSPKQKHVPQLVEYSDFRRVDNERQLEAIKSMLAGYMLNPNVVVQGTVEDKNGEPRVVQMSQFDAMLKATNLFLSAMNMQNKMWGLYMVPQTPKEPSTLGNIKNVTINMVQELQRIAKKENLALPAHGSRSTDNGAPNSDSR